MKRKTVLSVVMCLLFLVPFRGRAEGMMPGEVASVNGQGVYFSELESRRSRLFDALSPDEPPAIEAALQEQYRYALQGIIDELLICQYMGRNKLDLAPDALAAEEALIRADYPEGGFDQMLLEEGISLDLWRESLRRGLLVRKFQAEVLRPEITISPDEVNAYYKAHAGEFLIPEQWHFMQISGIDKKEVEQARDSFIQTRNATAVQLSRPVSIHDIRAAIDRLPEAVSGELARLMPWKAAPVKPFEKEFRVFVLLEKTPATELGTEEIYRRVEQAIAEEKLQSVYVRWMEKQRAKAAIRIAPELMPGAALPGAPGAEPGGGGNGTSSAGGPGRPVAGGANPGAPSVPDEENAAPGK